MKAQTKDGKHKKATTYKKSKNRWGGGYEGWDKVDSLKVKERNKE